jgi:hypothetical protein
MSDPFELKGSLVLEDSSFIDQASSTSLKTKAATPKPTNEDRMRQRFRTIFEMLKPTPRGTLNCATVTRCNLTDEQAIFLRPLLEKLVASEHEMGFDEFCTELAHLQKLKNLTDITRLFTRSRNSAPASRLSQSRKQSSCEMKVKPEEVSDFYARQVTQQESKLKFLKSVRRRLEARELAECTFKPKIKRVLSTVDRFWL